MIVIDYLQVAIDRNSLEVDGVTVFEPVLGAFKAVAQSQRVPIIHVPESGIAQRSDKRPTWEDLSEVVSSDALIKHVDVALLTLS